MFKLLPDHPLRGRTIESSRFDFFFGRGPGAKFRKKPQNSLAT
jgi:hypothetical protein